MNNKNPAYRNGRVTTTRPVDEVKLMREKRGASILGFLELDFIINL